MHPTHWILLFGSPVLGLKGLSPTFFENEKLSNDVDQNTNLFNSYLT
jgi:hypothetical protein